MTKKIIFRGVGTALVTPMKHGSIDYPSLSKIIEKQIAGGVGALIVGGTTGEAATLTDDERYELYTYVKGVVQGRVKIIFGTGTNDTRMAIKHTRVASDIGCDGVLTVTPYYNKGKALYKNLPFVGTFSINSSTSQSFVILHLPPPVKSSFLPREEFFSSNITFEVSLDAIAAIIPAGPPPIIAISYSILSMGLICVCLLGRVHIHGCFQNR